MTWKIEWMDHRPQERGFIPGQTEHEVYRNRVTLGYRVVEILNDFPDAYLRVNECTNYFTNEVRDWTPEEVENWRKVYQQNWCPLPIRRNKQGLKK